MITSSDTPTSRTSWLVYSRYFQDSWPRLSLSLILILVQTFSLIPIAGVFKHIFDTVLPGGDVDGLVTALGVAAGLFALNAVALIGNRHLVLSIVKSTTHAIRMKLISQVLMQDRRFYGEEDLDELHTRLVHDSERIDFMTNSLLTQFIPGMLIVAGLAGFLAWLNPFLFAVMAAVLPVLLVVSRYIGARVQQKTRLFREDYVAFSKGVAVLLKFNDHISASGAKGHELENQEILVDRLHKSSHAMSWLNTAHGVLNHNLLILSGLLTLLVGGMQVMDKVATFGSLLAFYAALTLLSNNARNALGSLPVIIEGNESLRSLFPLLAVESASPSGESFAGFAEAIVFDQVGFSYDEGFTLSDINLKVRKGEAIGIYGPSGSGKSTIISLMAGLYRPLHGTIKVDNVSLAELDLESYRRRIGILLQDPAIFFGTIRENLIYGLKDIEDEDIVRACSICGIHSFVTTLPDGYDTRVGERGVKISGGQKQRLALARVLLRNPELIILDEPNNHLPPDDIEDILRSLRAAGHTLVVVSHDSGLRSQLDHLYECVPVENTGSVTLKYIA